VPRTVSVTFSVAAFGAGIGFTLVGSPASVVLPANSISRHCIKWTSTPVSNGNLHRCIRVRISQPGFLDQVSQRNGDLRRLRLGSLAELLALKIPCSLGNPERFPQELMVRVRLVRLRGSRGIVDPEPPAIEGVQPIIVPDPPAILGANEALTLTLGFVQTEAAADEVVADQGWRGATQVEVAVSLNGKPASGFSVVLQTPLRTYLPLVMR
jgi:hypothetical protein